MSAYLPGAVALGVPVTLYVASAGMGVIFGPCGLPVSVKTVGENINIVYVRYGPVGQLGWPIEFPANANARQRSINIFFIEFLLKRSSDFRDLLGVLELDARHECPAFFGQRAITRVKLAH